MHTRTSFRLSMQYALVQGAKLPCKWGTKIFIEKKPAASGIVFAFAAIPHETALVYLRNYYGLGAWEGRAYTGSYFDSLPAGATDRVTAEDLVAVACLSIHVPAAAAVKVLEEQADEIAALLAVMPAVNLEDISL